MHGAAAAAIMHGLFRIQMRRCRDRFMKWTQFADGSSQVAAVLWTAKKYTANGLVRRGCPLTSQTAFGGQLPYKGSLVQPAVKFNHSPFLSNGRLLRATNHEPRATIFLRAEGHSSDVVILRLLPCSGIWVWGGQRGRQAQNSMNDERPTTNEKRHLSPRRTAVCGRRPSGHDTGIIPSHLGTSVAGCVTWVRYSVYDYDLTAFSTYS